jgi:hypothetical protein
MIKKKAVYKSSCLKIFFDFGGRELKAIEDKLKDKKIIKSEYNEVSLLKVSYQERLIHF